MSVNTAHCNDGISIYADERIIFKRPGVYLKFKGSDLPPAMKKDAGGSMFLTQFRMIFLSEKSKGPLKSFSFPFHSVSGKFVICLAEMINENLEERDEAKYLLEVEKRKCEVSKSPRAKNVELLSIGVSEELLNENENSFFLYILV